MEMLYSTFKEVLYPHLGDNWEYSHTTLGIIINDIEWELILFTT